MALDTVWIAPDVVMDNITTVIDESAVLHRLHLEIPAGKITVLMGPSGGGKTTLIRHLVGLLEPTGGSVFVNGQDIWDSTPDEWRKIRKNVGAMLGGSNMYTASTFSSLSVLQNLMYSLDAIGVPSELQEPRALARLEELDLVQEQNQQPEQLPAHAKKRLALARALVLDAPLTVLDEVDVGMDSMHTDSMLQAVRGVHERVGATMLVTTHDLGVARALADNLAILVHGRIVAFGPPEEILEGIESTEDFDRRFEFSDYRGPAQLEEAEEIVRRSRKDEEQRQEPRRADRPMLWVAIGAVVLIALIIVITRVNFF
ncbi:MAG TPA: ATP-binding cassette domain-containing protein [Pseudonocardia sp.]|jgi:phospholipid/cholesterol/gamma-HCH transport system ATP-binding protein|nr:ATP-binding cassette domain-containing protein [Pseudonocardia sp.]